MTTPFRLRKPGGFSLIELLVVMAIITVLISLLAAALHRMRLVGQRIKCHCHLANIGLGLHDYHDTHGMFPGDNGNWGLNGSSMPAGDSYAYAILPYIEQGPQVAPASTAGDWNNRVGSQRPDIKAIRIYICAGRRTTSAGPVLDYGSGNICLYGVGGTPAGPCQSDAGWPFKTILGAYSAKKPTLEQITDADGTANTILLAHKGMRPQDYDSGSGGSTNDDSWFSTNPYDHHRSAFYCVQDTNDPPVPGLYEMWDVMGGPHRNVSPTLFADGSVRNISYGLSTEVCGALWTWDDGIPLGGSYVGF
jgi:prepilin-type N-terminal cleavage/methylation domain-containing protein